MFNSKIIAFENCVAGRAVTNDDLSKFIETSDEWISSRTGIKQRIISDDKNTSDLCIDTAWKLLKKTNLTPDDIDLIIIATLSPDFLTPSTACIVQGKIGASNAVAFDINAACSGFVYALCTAEKFIRCGTYKNIMVLGAETLSKLIDWSDRNTCVLFGDGAGGVIISRTESGKNCIIAEDMHTDGKKCQAITANELPLNNIFVKAPDDTKHFVGMNGREVFSFATRKVPKSINAVLKKSGLSFDDIKYIVPHQANTRIIEIVAKKLNLPLDKFYLNTDRFGNTSAASIPIALGEMSEKNLLQNGDKIIITGFGGGLTWGSVLIEI